MAQIRPFKAYRPCKGMEERIAALPYEMYITGRKRMKW